MTTEDVLDHRARRAPAPADQAAHAEATPDAPADDFPRLTDPYRRELLAHCYRMLGSVQDAEDLVQETYLRAWRSYDRFEGRSSVRTWLHRIATNACLTALEGKQRRPLPTGLGAPSSDPEGPLNQRTEVPWLEPLPDSLVGTGAAEAAEVSDPAYQATSRESIRLAFVAALQHLPPRQRAVLILRDVLAWKAAEVADAVGVSTAAANSLLQRARTQLKEVAPTQESVAEPESPELRAMLDRYVNAFWDKDIDAIVSMLTEDAVWEMPPFDGWYLGADAIGRLIATQCPGGVHDMRMLPARANGQPAFGLYMRGEDDAYHPFQLQVLTLSPATAEPREGGADGFRVKHVAAFFEHGLFARFGLPDSLPAGWQPQG